MTHPLRDQLVLRVLLLTCVTEAWAELWEELFVDQYRNDEWSSPPRGGRRDITPIVSRWDNTVPLRRASERRQAELELDVIVALAHALTADELCTAYRTQFSVLYGYDRNTYFYDANGRLVPNSVLTTWKKKGATISEDERTATNQSGNTYTYELPFVTLDREADMRQAYTHFEKILAERS